MSGFQQARIDLGVRLRQLRETAHLSGKQLAERLGWQPSKVSRIENARQTATEDDVVVWCQAVNASAELIDELLLVVISLAERQDSWRQRHRGGLAALQEDMRGLEARTTTFRVFEPGVVIGLLQTAEYARNIFTKVRRIYGTADQIDAAIRVRMRRQEILYDQRRTFRFLMPESVLRYRLAPADVMCGQLDRLIAVTSLPNVEFGVVPFDVVLPSAPLNGFWIYDDAMVGVATRTKELMLKGTEEVTFYTGVYDDFCEVAAFGEDARAIIIRTLHAYSEQSGS
ncbi:MAG TPA: helix-turn-helix transcriptional regulator [Thermopolyspora sp.]